MIKFPRDAPLVTALNITYTNQILEKIVQGKVNKKRQALASNFHAANITHNNDYRTLVKSLDDSYLAEEGIDPHYYFFECYLKLQWLKTNGRQSPGANYKIIKYAAEHAIPIEVKEIVTLRSNSSTAYINRNCFCESDVFFIGKQKLYMISEGKLVLFWKQLGFKARPFCKDNNVLNLTRANLVPPPQNCRVYDNNSIKAGERYFSLSDYDNNYARMFRIIERGLSFESEDSAPKRRADPPEAEEPSQLEPLLDSGDEKYREMVASYATIRQDERVFKQPCVRVDFKMRLLSQCIVDYDPAYEHVLYLDGQPHNLRSANLQRAPLNVFWDSEKHAVYYYDRLRTLPRRIYIKTSVPLPKAIELAKVQVDKSGHRPKLPQGVLPPIDSGVATSVRHTDAGYEYWRKDTRELAVAELPTIAHQNKLYGNRFMVFNDVIEIILSQGDRIDSIVIDVNKIDTGVLRHRWHEVTNGTFENEEGAELVNFLFQRSRNDFWILDGNPRNLRHRNLCQKTPGFFWEVVRQRLIVTIPNTPRLVLTPDLEKHDLQTIIRQHLLQHRTQINV